MSTANQPDAATAADATKAAAPSAKPPSNEKPPAQPWSPKKGADCHVMLLLGGPRLAKRPAKVLAVRTGGEIDAEVIMPTGEIVKREGLMPAASSRLGDGYLE